MSRIIRFRAWNHKHKYMDDTFFIRAFDGQTFDKPKASYNTPNAEIESSDEFSHVMQFTGLNDINGVEIYEGDIIECWGYELVVKWIDSDASFFAESFDQSICESGQEWGFVCEVIGNIYQNPELLNK